MKRLSFQVNLGETLLEAEASENVESPVNCFRKLFGELNTKIKNFIAFIFTPRLSHAELYIYFCVISVCDVLPLVIKNVDMRLPASLMQKYMLKAAEFYIGYVTRGPSTDVQIHGKAALCWHIFSLWQQLVDTKNLRTLYIAEGSFIVFFFLFVFDLLSLFHLSFVLASQEGGSLKSPGVSRGSQRYVIDGLSEKSSLVAEPWERLLDILAVAGARCEWQGDKGQR